MPKLVLNHDYTKLNHFTSRTKTEPPLKSKPGLHLTICTEPPGHYFSSH